MAQGRDKKVKKPKADKRPTAAKINKEIAKTKKGGPVSAPKHGKEKMEFFQSQKKVTKKLHQDIEQIILERAAKVGEKLTVFNTDHIKTDDKKKGKKK